MINRIKEIAAHYGLSSTGFADRIEVARPVISHILSERNRPSLEVVQKIGVAFPEINLDWLLFGKEAMLKNIAYPESSFPENLSVPVQVSSPVDLEKEGNLNKINANQEEVAFVTKTSASAAKTIRKVLIFYSDHTFEEFNPSEQN
jgi:DNA-binding XRE family transcriptional regulator